MKKPKVKAKKAPKKRINSRAKGAVGERELAAFLTAYGFAARRGQQFSGGADSPDVKCEGLDDFHLECKRVEAGQLYNWLAQAKRDAGTMKTPVVAHRRNGKHWVAILNLEDLLNIILCRSST